MDADVAATALDVALERGLLAGVERVAGGREPEHHLVAGEVGVVEHGGVLRRGHGEPVPGAEVLHGRDPAGIEPCRKPVVRVKTRTS